MPSRYTLWDGLSSMNQRIQELAKQAGIVIPKDSEYNGHIYRNAIEKFSQLIIKECADVCNQRARSAPMGSDEQCEAEDCAHAMIKHFGVEE